jgi:hypothetical protein
MAAGKQREGGAVDKVHPIYPSKAPSPTRPYLLIANSAINASLDPLIRLAPSGPTGD